MGKTRWMTGSVVGLALLTGSITPAQARPRYDRGGWDHYHHDRGNGFGFGDAVGVAALVGAVAIVASSMSKDKKAAQGQARDNGDYADDTSPPPATNTDYGADVRDTNAPLGSDNDQMTDACAVAARDEAQGQSLGQSQNQGGYAEIRRIDDPRAIDGGYNIDGQVETRASYRATSGITRRFTCTIKDGRVADVYLSRDVVTR
ncbi:MAG: hypothetical protein PSY12_06825 [bacterium]|nr:hypothetical protein [bacterium]